MEARRCQISLSCPLLCSDDQWLSRCQAAACNQTEGRQRGNTFPASQAASAAAAFWTGAGATKIKKSLKRGEKNGELSDFYLLMNGSSVTAATVTILSLITLSIHCPLLLDIYLSTLEYFMRKACVFNKDRNIAPFGGAFIWPQTAVWQFNIFTQWTQTKLTSPYWRSDATLWMWQCLKLSH